jgi:hypothetical protein
MPHLPHVPSFDQLYWAKSTNCEDSSCVTFAPSSCFSYHVTQTLFRYRRAAYCSFGNISSHSGFEVSSLLNLIYYIYILGENLCLCVVIPVINPTLFFVSGRFVTVRNRHEPVTVAARTKA